MKTQSIPAQITTVEDKIVGNLNLTQIMLLIVPVFWVMIVYTLFYPTMSFAIYKLPLILSVSLTSIVLSVRFKNKLILNWLKILLKYNLRPRYYVFNKNESFLRQIDIVSMPLHTYKKASVPQIAKAAVRKDVSFVDLVRLERLITNPSYTLTVKSFKKGGLNVSFEQVKQ